MSKVRIIAAIRLVVFCAFLGMVFLFSGKRGYYLLPLLSIPLFISVLQLKTGSTIQQLVRSLLPLRGWKLVGVAATLWVITISMIWCLWSLVRTAQ
jgi:hypothetical protein